MSETLSQEKIDAMIDQAAERGAKRALASIGLDDEDAGPALQTRKTQSLHRAAILIDDEKLHPDSFQTVAYEHQREPSNENATPRGP